MGPNSPAFLHVEVMPVLVAGSREQIEVIIEGKVWWLVRRLSLCLPFFDQLLPLLR